MAKEKRVKEPRESKPKGNSMGAAGFTIGILSILTLGIFGIVMSVIGFGLCFFQQKNKPTKLAKAGLIINIIGLILSLIWIFYLAPILANWMQSHLSSIPSA